MPSGCGDDADRTISPVSASQTTTLQDWVDESIPATSATPAKLLRCDGSWSPPRSWRWRRRASSTNSNTSIPTSSGASGARDGQRYTLAVMNDLGGEGGYDDGVATTTHLSELLLAGRDAG